MRALFILIVACAFFFSCERTIQLDLDQTAPVVVIEGQVTNHPGYQYVKLSWSSAFYDKSQSERITDANVSVTDDLGETIDFVHNPGDDPDSAGYYLPVTSFTGSIGRTYTLDVLVNGQHFTATDKLLSVIGIDSLKYDVNDFQLEDEDNKGKVFEILLYAHEPQNEDNFYLFKFYRNDSLIYNNETDIYYSDDELLAESINGVPSPVYYGPNDNANVEIYSLSREGYVYFNDLSTILNNDGGGMFGPIPSAPRTNLSNGALGFFQVSAMNSSSIRIE